MFFTHLSLFVLEFVPLWIYRKWSLWVFYLESSKSLLTLGLILDSLLLFRHLIIRINFKFISLFMHEFNVFFFEHDLAFDLEVKVFYLLVEEFIHIKLLVIPNYPTFLREVHELRVLLMLLVKIIISILEPELIFLPLLFLLFLSIFL